jgi:hypothetical protein
MEWHKKAIIEGRKKTLISGAIAGCFFVVLGVWMFATGKTFTWQSIEVLSPLPPWAKLWSGLTFSTTGFLLFHLGFYKALYNMIPFYPLYSLVKAIIWLLLTLLTYWFFDFIFKAVNVACSFFFNVWQLIVFVAPALGITIGMFLSALLVRYIVKNRNKHILHSN